VVSPALEGALVQRLVAMALGFGFNKAKVLASAEKFVQQGKLQSAIAEYEKVIKEDPKDLTVLNTVGDLCARVGQNEQAAHYFKRVGDHYAQDGFTVKAIAIYKKLTKLSPGNFENINKLAELYSQQGLFSDARAQYMHVADHLLRSGDNAQAARIFQRVLELDPENTATQSKLADLYLKLGKKEEARKIYCTAAESLYARGSYDAAKEALGRVLTMDPQNPSAQLLRGMIAADSGDAAAAVQHLERVSDLDSRPDGLRALLRAKLESGSLEGAEGLASKLVTVHNDVGGVSALAQWYVANNGVGRALKLYELHADRFMAADKTGFQEAVYPLIGRIKENPEALSALLRLLQKVGDSSHSAEIMELQAHAFAQKADFKQARDLYQKLAELEPENSLHSQNYKQMLSKLGEDPTTRVLSPEEAAQAFMVEELEQGAPAIHQNYDPPTERAIEAALTDAELFVSYNVPAKAIPPLEAVLPLAPRDVAVNQRLATLYARGTRYADAARICQVLSDIYREAGHNTEAERYLEAARNYARRAPGTPAVAPAPPPAEKPVRPTDGSPRRPTGLAPAVPAAGQPAVEFEIPAEHAAPSVQDFSFDVPDHLFTGAEPPAAPAHTDTQPIPPLEMSVQAPETTAEPVAHAAKAARAAPAEHEIDVSSEWENMLSVESAGQPATTQPIPEMQVVAVSEDQPAPTAEAETEAGAPAPASAETVAEKIQEIHFYLSREMWDAAKGAILDLTEIAPDAPEVTELIGAVSAGQSRAAAAAAAASAPKPVVPQPPLATPKPPSAALAVEPAPRLEETPDVEEILLEVQNEPPAAKKPAREFSREKFIAPPKSEASAMPVAKAPLGDILAEPAATKAPPRSAVPSRERAPAPAAKSPLDDILDVAKLQPPPVQPATSVLRTAAKEKSTEDVLTDFVLDLEKTELADFVPRAKPDPVPPAKAPAPPGSVASAPAPPAVFTPAASATAASRADLPARESRVNGDMRDAESASVLGDILFELQEETVAPVGTDEDPETHYNLGIAFKEMGLLDEAIGELQKVCHSMDRGSSFSQPIQAYTWLAQCLVDKGVPEAAVRWYKRALQLPTLDDGSRCAIYYDLALAFEASGDKKSALVNFMEVYGSNIDFRDVASRIKALKS
jgi:tetratricopeptide (TPR) repeat protein